MIRRRAVMSWSSGKDSAYALHVARASGALDVVALLSTVNESVDRVSMHGVRRSLLERQAEALGLPLLTVELPDPCTNEVYEARMAAFVERARAMGVEAMIFGDLFLEDIRAYRESRLEGTGIEAVFPIFGRDTKELAESMWREGIVATLTTVDTRVVPEALVGRRWDRALVEAFPGGVDPCGENGEFHSFVSDGPGFSRPIAIEVGEVVRRDPFVYADLFEAQRP